VDTTIERIAAYAQALTFESLPREAVHETRRRIIDALGCGLGAYDDEPCRMARKLASRVKVESGARILGTLHRTLPELATFANGVMTRYLDGNDTLPGGGGHPSDTIAPMLSVADARGADGKALIAAIAVAYEIYYAFFRGAIMRERGLDHVLYTAVASAVGAAKLLGFDVRKLAQAVSLAITPNIALHSTRRGDLSMWKGVAAANAARNGVFAALLAAEGMTGPDNAIEGSHGLRELVGNFELGALAAPNGEFKVTQSNLKFFLSEYHSQSPITAALQLSREVKPTTLSRSPSIRIGLPGTRSAASLKNGIRPRGRVRMSAVHHFSGTARRRIQRCYFFRRTHTRSRSARAGRQGVGQGGSGVHPPLFSGHPVSSRNPHAPR
jgi:2-methylcitrate dehydratase